MDDRELLERAARAAGFTPCGWLDFTGLTDWHGADSGIEVEENGGPWNPLENDGDAFRLMVVCRLCLGVSDDDGGCTRIIDEFGDTILREMHFNDDNENAATRRAIVRAAAAMGDES